ncbi:MAG TPA: Ig-like domain-containing protein [Candidatus Binatia bacterium]|nr:Ig-like domain-containing protein [Candidatus Binatia bacterium]
MRLPQSLILRPLVYRFQFANRLRKFLSFHGFLEGKIALASLACVTLSLAGFAQTADYYVSPTGNDNNPGTLEEPFATFNKARTSADALLQKSGGRTNPITVMFRAGTYYFTSTLNLSSADSGTSSLGIVYENYPGETPVFSGGEQLTGWSSQGNGTWEITLHSGTQYFESLWYNGQRRFRPRLGSSSNNVGTYYRIASPVYTSSPQTNCTVESSPGQYECYDRFQYTSTDPISKSWQNLSPASGNPCGAAGNSYPAGDIELDLFERWNMSKMRISCIDTNNHIIYFTGPTATAQNSTSLGNQTPIAGHRYLIENIKDDLKEPGQWFLDRSSSNWTLTYIANSGEDPNNDTVIIPQLAQLIVAQNLKYVTFTGLTFENDNWTIPQAGYPSVQQENGIPAAISCQNCQYITFDNSTVTQTMGGGLEFITTSTSSTTAHNMVENSMFYDLGAMGVRIGMLPYYTDTDSNVPQFNTVQNTAIEGFGRIIASSPALSQGDAHDNTYTHNDIYDGYQDGIELCAPACELGQSNSRGVFNNVSSFNHIYNIGQGILNDMGCIYYDTWPTSTGNQILNNKCHDVMDASGLDSDGYAGHGYYLDLNTSNVLVENNLAYRLSAMAMAQTCGPQSANTANTIKNNTFAFFAQASKQQGCVPAGNGILQFNFTNNLVFYEPRTTVQAMCVYSPSGDLPAVQNYQENMYCYAGATNCTLPSNAFFTSDASCQVHTSQTFSSWQALGEDKGSMVANPLFTNPYYPTDDFSLQSGSPASEVGFVAFDVNAPGREAGAAAVPAITPGYPTYAIEGISNVSISSSATPSTWGESVTLTATVSSPVGPPPSGETVTFSNGNESLGTATLSQGTASIKTSTLPVGTNSIQVSYAGDTMWSGSTSNTFNQHVNNATTTTSVGSSLNPANAGQQVTFTATVTSSYVVPTGTVTFKADGTTLGTATLINGVAKYSTTTLRSGTTNISAQYSPATGFDVSSGTMSEVIDQFGSTTTITAATPNPASSGQAVTFTAKVTGDSPTGTVRFYTGSTYLGKATLSNGTGSYTTNGRQLPTGSDSITATYSGDSNNAESTSKAVVETVN